MVFRFGGEEFSVILPETDGKGARIVSENIRKSIEYLCIPHEGSQVSDYVTVSIGIGTVIPTRKEKMAQLIEMADKALYKAKQDGRNCVRA